MIRIEDVNQERYHINPKLVIYVKERLHNDREMFKILLVNGEVIMTTNKSGAEAIISAMIK